MPRPFSLHSAKIFEDLIEHMESLMQHKIVRESESFESRERINIVCALRHIIDNELITPYFQPIFRLEPFDILGYEVLSRPQQSALLPNPEILFQNAIEFGFYQELELLAWKKALRYISQTSTKQKLFMNCNPYLVEGDKFDLVESIFTDEGIETDQIVLEITERSAINDYKKFKEEIQRFRDVGFAFAVDDIGGGYSSLGSVVDVRPEIIKIDRHIITHIAHDEFKSSIVSGIVSICQKNGILSIAEGVESKEDLNEIRRLGVDAVQGFYLYEPRAYIDEREVAALEFY